MEKLNLNRKALKNFGITMGIVFLLIALLVFVKHKHIPLPLISVSVVFFTLGFAFPGFLKYVYIIWMKLASILGWLNARLILCIIFYLVFTPVGLIMKLCKIDLLDRKIDNKTSYWIKKITHKSSNYERQF